MPAIAESTTTDLFEVGTSFREGLVEPKGSSWKTLEILRQRIAAAISTSRFLLAEKEYWGLHLTLKEYSQLADNWDSYGAARPSVHSVDVAERFLKRLFAEAFLPDRMIPSAEGGIAVYFNCGSKTAYVEYRNSGEVILAMYDDRSDPVVVELSESDDDESRAISLIRTYITE